MRPRFIFAASGDATYLLSREHLQYPFRFDQRHSFAWSGVGTAEARACKLSAVPRVLSMICTFSCDSVVQGCTVPL